MSDAPPPRNDNSPRPRRRVLRAAAMAVAALLAALALLALGARLRPDLAGAVLLRALAAAGVSVRAESLDLRLFPPVLEAQGLDIDAGPGLRLRARSLLAEAGPWLGLGGGPALAALEARGLKADVALGGHASGGTGNPLAVLDRVGRVVLNDADLRLAGADGDLLAALSGLTLALEAPAVGHAGRSLGLRADLALEPGGEMPPLSGDLAVNGTVLPGGSVAAELALDGRLGNGRDGASVSGDVLVHALAAWDASASGAGGLDVSALDVSGLDVSLTDFLAAPTDGVRIAGGRAWLQAGLQWEPGRMPDVRRAHLALEGCMFQADIGADIGADTGSPVLSGGLDMEAELRSGDVWLGQRLDMESCRVLFTDLEARLPGGPLRVPLATVRARGSLDPADMSLSLDRADLRLGRDGRLLEAVAGVRRDHGGRWRADLAGRASEPGRVLDMLRPLLPDALPRTLRGLRLTGDLPVYATWRYPGRSHDDDGAVAGLTAGVAPKGLRLRWSAHGLSAMLEGRCDLSLPVRGEAALSGRLAAAGTVRAGPLEARRAVVRADLSGAPSRPVLGGLRVNVPAGDLSWDGVVLPLGKAALRCDLEASSEGLDIRGLSLSAGPGRVTGDMRLPLSAPLDGAARLAADSLDLRACAQILQAMGLVPADLPLTGGAASLALAMREGEASLEAGLHGLSMATADQSLMAEGLEGVFTARADLAGRRSWRAGLDVGRGQFLAGTVFVDFAAMPLAASLAARDDGLGGLTDASGGLELGGLGAVDLHWGSLTRGNGDWSWAGHATLRDPDLTGLLETFVRQPWAFSRPDLATLQADLAPGGSASLDISLAASPGLPGKPIVVDMAGRLRLIGADADWPAKGVNATGLDLDLPFAYTFGPDPDPDAPLPWPPDDASRWGRLRCKALATPTGVLEDLDLGLALEPGGLFTRGEAAVPVLGGRLVLGPARVADPLSPAFRLQVPARLEDVDLSRVRPAGVPLQGSLSGDLGPVRVDMARLEAPGVLSGRFFGGELAVSGLAVDRPLDQGRVVGIDRAEVRGLDLERLSVALDAGRVTGRMDVGLDHAAVAWGQPQRMDLRVESVETPGVRQLVSLKAVNAISVIGTGSGLTDVGVGMFASFFKEFAYDSIGISCSLHNDVFRVRGLIHSAGVEYLIKKPLFFGINVVNRNPDNRISFSDMMERVGRVVGQGSGTNDSPKEQP